LYLVSDSYNEARAATSQVLRASGFSTIIFQLLALQMERKKINQAALWDVDRQNRNQSQTEQKPGLKLGT
jgi:hypothetical protein